ncbi:hypothetical protein MMC25_003978 [Agyrium rufum]|nr:hypothetical protein [Agyrium rufum]
MPVHPSEEEAPTGIYEKIAKDPSSTTESTASSHEDHHNEHTPGLATINDLSKKGPAIPQSMDDMPPKASKEELDAKMKELNQS